MARPSVTRETISATATTEIDLTQTAFNNPHTFIGRIFRDAEGNQVVPTSGTYSIQIKLNGMPDFETIVNGTNIVASQAIADSIDFAGNAIALRYIPNGIVGATTIDITLTANRA